MPIRALIVDDEELARSEMRFLLEGMEDVVVVGEASGGEEAVRLVSELAPDLLFLDIQMPVLDGFGVVRRLIERGAPPLVVFTTAYDQYAIRAFEIHAADYLLKPIERERLAEAVQRSREILPSRGEAAERLRRLTGHIKAGRKFLPRLVVRRGDGVDPVDADRVSLI
ncbi:MAG: response regulator, partial [Candidatus Krumholzibacteria bacterium]|nr:response regulator [Candidatus Krumholzibacteria bacterium]